MEKKKIGKENIAFYESVINYYSEMHLFKQANKYLL